MEKKISIQKPRLVRPFKISAERRSRIQILSSGGGTQSSCLVVLAHMGAIPKPDVVVMADTGYEDTRVIEFQKKYLAPLCEDMQVNYFFVKRADYTNADIRLSPDNDSVLPPFFTTFNGRDKNGECAGKQPTWCSDKWKGVVVRRFVNKRYGQLNLSRTGVDFWIGMSADEGKRVKYPSGKWQKRYPLFEAGIDRQQAIQIVERYNIPTPPMSACWMCPNRHDDEWQAMKLYNPSDLERAGQFEEELQKDFPWLWLHKSGIPIREVDFVAHSKSDKQIDIFQNHCDSGMCFV